MLYFCREEEPVSSFGIALVESLQSADERELAREIVIRGMRIVPLEQ